MLISEANDTKQNVPVQNDVLSFSFNTIAQKQAILEQQEEHGWLLFRHNEQKW